MVLKLHRADRGPHRAGTAATSPTSSERAAAAAAPRDPGGVPGPDVLAQSAHAGARHRRRAAAGDRHWSAAAPTRARARDARRGRPAARRRPSATRTPSRGGQRQRIAIARALAAVAAPRRLRRGDLGARRLGAGADPEPDRATCRTRLGLSLMFISHNLGAVRHVSDRVAVMYLGRIVEHRAGSRHLRPAGASLHARAARRRAGAGRSTRPRRRRSRGEIPSPLDRPSGCHFHPRCPRRRPAAARRIRRCARAAPGITCAATSRTEDR